MQLRKQAPLPSGSASIERQRARPHQRQFVALSVLLLASLACNLLRGGTAGSTPVPIATVLPGGLTAAPATAAANATPAAGTPEPPLADQTVLTTEEIAAVSVGLPQDSAQAAALVAMIHGPDERTALAATAELLRRGGLPLVAVDGQVIALPDAFALVDAEIYINFVTELTRATRRGDAYTPDQLATLLAEIGYGEGLLPPAVLVAGLGQWGKAPEAPAESATAGAAVRSLAGRRLEVLYLGADLSLIEFDPLQTTLILAHATSRTLPRAGPVALAPRPAGGLRYSPAPQPGPCDALAQALEVPDQVQETMLEFMKGQIVDSWQEYALSEQARESLGKVTNVYEKGTAVLNTLLLMLGAQIELSDNKGGATHFKHSEGDRSTHVTMLALAYFDSTIAQREVACYKLAGIDVPPPGPLVGYRVRWSLAQTHGRGHQGKYLTPVSADSKKLDSCGSCGEITGPSGRSTLELYPPVEREPGKGVEFKGFAVVTASLDKDDFPFKLKDLLGLKNPAGFAASKTWDLAISAIQRAGLPSQTRTVRVDYHGAEIYIARGQKDVFAVFASAPVLLDVYTCEGLNGQWHGIGGFGDIATYELWLADFGADFPEGPATLREQNFMINPEAAESVFDIVPGLLAGVMRIDHGLIAANRAVVVNQTVGRPVGEVEVLLEGGTMDILGLGAPIFTVIWMPEDERCPGGGSYFENNP